MAKTNRRPCPVARACENRRSNQRLDASDGRARGSLCDGLSLPETAAVFEYAAGEAQTTKRRAKEDLAAQRRATLERKRAVAEQQRQVALAALGRQEDIMRRVSRITTVGGLRDQLDPLSENQKKELLKDQFRLRLAYGWDQFRTPFSSSKDPRVGTVGDLQAKCEAMIVEEVELGASPGEPPLRPGQDHARPAVLGTHTQQAVDLLELSKVKASGLREAAKALREQREAEKKKADRARHDKFALDQPAEPPAVDESLVGRRLEVLTWIEEPGEGDTLCYKKQWLACVVTRFADGSSSCKKRTRDGKQRKVAKGLCELHYDDGLVEWAKLTKFNNNSVGSWRMDLDFVGSSGLGPAEATEGAAAAAAAEPDEP